MSGPTALDAERLRANPLPRLGQRADKEARGRVLVVAGSAEVPGAALLGGEAALRTGSGKLQLAAPRSVAPALAMAIPESRVFALDETEDGEIAPDAVGRIERAVGGADAVLIGPGMLDKGGAGVLAARLLAVESQAVFILDAAAMTGLEDAAGTLRALAGRVVLTPHAGEMAALTGQSREEIEADPIAAACAAARMLKVVVALKGAQTAIASPDGAIWLYRDGCVGLGTAGSGDVLAGLIAGLAARGAAPLEATLWGVFLHGEAGRRLGERIGPLGFFARELAGEVPPILAELG